MKFEVVAEKYSKLPHDQKVEVGKKVYEQLNGSLVKLGYSEKEVKNFAVLLARLAAGADFEAAEEEFLLLTEITGIELNKGEFLALINNAKKESFVGPMDEIVDSLDENAKNAALALVALFLCADLEVSEEEKALFNRLEA